MNPVHIVLLISLAANGALGWAYLGQRDETTKAIADLGSMRDQRDGLSKVAGECSASVDDLRKRAELRYDVAAPARAAAASTAQNHNRRADAILAAPAPVPGDACASAQARVDDWLKGRAQP